MKIVALGIHNEKDSSENGTVDLTLKCAAEIR